jgi:thioredoxin 1
MLGSIPRLIQSRTMTLTRDEVDATPGALVLEFGASWCSICAGARPIIDRVRAEHPGVRHEWIEDGKGKPLGRSFAITLWPTLIFLRDGREVGRVVRPTHDTEIRHAFERMSPESPATALGD